jgi:two-component system response regulator HydG
LEEKGYEVHTATSSEEARKVVEQRFFDLLVLDERMPGISGTRFLAECRKRYPGIGAIFVTGYATVECAIRALRAGALDLLQKPLEKEALIGAVERALTESQLLREQRYFRHDSDQRATFAEIIGDSDPLRQTLNLVRQVIPTNVPVLLQGESGTGKELMARAIHFEGPRRGKPFVAVNVAAVSESLMESALFGHRKGAFTGATEDRQGYFEASSGGTIFLDEVGEMTAGLQVRLLRVLQQKSIMRVGETKDIPVNTRVIAATNRDLAQEVEKGRFREDLWYRLNVFTITVPPLRDRISDITPLALHILERRQIEIGKSVKSITSEALDRLQSYDWPGNVRELENVIQRAIILAEGDTIGPELILVESRNSDSHPLGRLSDLPFREAEKRFRTVYFTNLLARTKGNKTEAAKRAGLDRTSLHAHIRRIQKDRSSARPERPGGDSG